MNNFICVLSGDYSVYYILVHVLHCIFRSSRSDGFLVKGVPIMCSKFVEEHSSRSVISIKLQSNFMEITLRHGCSPVNCCIFSKHVFLRTPLGGCFCILSNGSRVCKSDEGLLSAFKVFILHVGHCRSSSFFPLKKHASRQFNQSLCSHFNTFIGFSHFCVINIIQFHLGGISSDFIREGN